MKDEEKREIAEQIYLVKKRKIRYLKNSTEIDKKIDVLLVSDESFKADTLTDLPETVIFLNVKNTLPENNNYTLKFSSEALKVFRSEK
ncbi:MULTISPECIES: hypothetical protein [unclassified Chryseobacterium]|nr:MULTISPECIES: hypothetical protein [unclassified Chryseobacterium]